MISYAILGCGAIARDRHLPAALSHPDIHIAALVDADLERADGLRRLYGLDCQITARREDLFNWDIQAALNALPNFLHTPVNVELLSAGIHVLCEKPLATTLEGARACVEAAEKSGAFLDVVMPRRFYGSTHLLSDVIEDGLLGPLQNYEWDHGVPFGWNTASGFYFSREQSGGGVLLDEGVHLLDCLTHWFGPVTDFRYQDDNWGGGIEANVILDLTHANQGRELPGRLRLSRTYTLKNRLLVRGGNADAEILRKAPNTLTIHRNLAGNPITAVLQAQDSLTQQDPFHAQLDSFVRAIQERSNPKATGRQALETIELIESCYSQATRIPEPWFDFSADVVGVQR